jgi:hypothetical protein
LTPPRSTVAPNGAVRPGSKSPRSTASRPAFGVVTALVQLAPFTFFYHRLRPSCLEAPDVERELQQLQRGRSRALPSHHRRTATSFTVKQAGEHATPATVPTRRALLRLRSGSGPDRACEASMCLRARTSISRRPSMTGRPVEPIPWKFLCGSTRARRRDLRASHKPSDLRGA